jgi:pimeloyl-ACP methyl ester carboxylesterase
MSIAAWAEHHDVAQRVFAVAMINTGVGGLIAESLLFPVPEFAKAVNKALAVHGFLGARAPLPRTSTPASHAAIRYIAFGPEATPAQIAFYERMLVATPPDARASIGIAMSELELHHALEHITTPTLVIGGENDRLTPPSHARKIAEMVPNLDRLIVLPDTGHMAPLERPAEVSRAIAKLVARSADAHQPMADGARET